MDPYRSVWSRLAHYGPVLPYESLYWPRLAHMAQYDPVWAKWHHNIYYDPIQRCMVRMALYSPVEASMALFGLI